MAHDVFISYGSPDKPIADAACAFLEGRGVRCWIAPRDVRPGMPYGGELSAALRDARILVLILSSHANYSSHVAREVEQAVHFGLRIIPLRIEDVKPSDDLGYFINSVHWLDALTPPVEAHLQQLGVAVDRLLPPTDSDRRSVHPTPLQPPPVPRARTAPPAGARPRTAVIAAAVAGIAATGVLVQQRSGQRSAPLAVEALGTAAASEGEPVHGNDSVRSAAGDPASAAAPAPERAPTRPPSSAPAARAPAQPTVATATPEPGPAATPAAPSAEARSFVGCWRYPTGNVLHMMPDGTIEGAALPGRWKAAPDGRYIITWPTYVDRITLSERGNRLSGVNNYGLPARASREGDDVTDRRSLVGGWSYNNIPMVARDDGTIIGGGFRGRWRAADAGTFVIDWTHQPIDDLSISASGSTLMGSNNLNVLIAASRVSCGA